ncbi:MAG: signal peptidase I [Lachnospiraceae bacterium]|nr:signal peptidase I [Lachnospiraceae bacterium]
MQSYYTSTYMSRKRKRQLREKIIFYIVGIVLAVLAAFLLIRFCFFGIHMRGDSMKPSIKDGQFCIASRLNYSISSPKRDDIVVFQNGEEGHSYYIKRVVAVPGDTIVIKDGEILVNGKKIDQKGSETILSGGLAGKEVKLEKDQYFVLGDNYNNSEDSRVSSVGNVMEENVIGKIILKLW